MVSDAFKKSKTSIRYLLLIYCIGIITIKPSSSRVVLSDVNLSAECFLMFRKCSLVCGKKLTYGPESAKTRLRVNFHKMTFSHFQLLLGKGGQETKYYRCGSTHSGIKSISNTPGYCVKKSKKNTKLLSQKRNFEGSTRLKEETWIFFV